MPKKAGPRIGASSWSSSKAAHSPAVPITAAAQRLSAQDWQILADTLYRDDDGKLDMDRTVVVCGDDVPSCAGGVYSGVFLRDSFPAPAQSRTSP
jgi:hypothetical protein